MAYVIAVCGAGGKTTKCDELAYRYIDERKKTCVLTTTHMWLDKNLDNINELSDISDKKVYYFGEIEGEKVISVSDKDYKKICNCFDYVIIEADGSQMMPLKIPRYEKNGKDIIYTEPVIPDNVNEIIVVMGLESLNREIGAVCQHFENIKKTYKLSLSKGKTEKKSTEKKDSNNLKKVNLKNIEGDYIVDEDLIDDIIDYYYIVPLRSRFKKAKLTVEKIEFSESKNYEKIKKVALVLCASGFSRRFGDENKLLARLPVDLNSIYDDGTSNIQKDEKPYLYRLMADKLLTTKKIIQEKFNHRFSYNFLSIDLAIVSQFDEILNDKELKNHFTMLYNGYADDGLSSSIKIATLNYRNYDAIMFLNSDIPKLPVNELASFLYNSICSNSKLSSMYTDIPKSPAYFESDYFDEILKISGDVGPKNLLTKYKIEAYKYHIDNKYLFDIDTFDDLKMILK